MSPATFWAWVANQNGAVRCWISAASLLTLCAFGALLWTQGRGSVAQTALPLGSESRCAGYSGLPAARDDRSKTGMVHIPAGEFTFGTTLGYPEERPATSARLQVAAFWMDQTEVTNAQFASFVKATRYTTDAERDGGAVVFGVSGSGALAQRNNAWWRFVQGADWAHPAGPGSAGNTVQALANEPVTQVTQADALAYARWLGRDLPTEAEWEYAGKAGRGDADIEKAPRDAAGKPVANFWQGAFPWLNTLEDGHAGLAPVGCYPANAFGLYDMVGNVWEWTRDAYTDQHQQPSHANGDTLAVRVAALTEGSKASATHKPSPPGQPVVIKGGSFLCSPDFCVRYRASAREAQESNLPTAHIGFRTIIRD